MEKTQSNSTQEPYSARIKDPELRRELDDRIERAKAQKVTGAKSFVIEALLRQAVDGEPLDRLTSEVAALRRELGEVRNDFAYCIQTVLVAAKLAPPEVAAAWVKKYFEDAETTTED